MASSSCANLVKEMAKKVFDRWWFERGEVVLYKGSLWAVWGPSTAGCYNLIGIEGSVDHPVCTEEAIGGDLIRQGWSVQA